MKQKHRTFIAINLPLDIKKCLAQYKKKWQDLPAKWTPEENLHITLVFLGDLSDEEVGEVCLTTKKIAATYQPQDIILEKVCYGPDNKLPPKMLWAIGKKNKELAQLKQNLENALTETIVNFTPENRGFTPPCHISKN